MRLTTDMLRASYELLCECRPYRHWNLPPADEVRFKVTRSLEIDGYYLYPKQEIGISSLSHQHLYSVLVTMAHEMVHLYMRETAMDRKVADHGVAFRKLAARVSAELGFDAGQF